MAKPVAWSYSALTAFETCAYRFQQARITKKFPEQQTAETIWGNKVHKALELRVGKRVPLPEDMQQYEPIAAKLCARHGIVRVEQKMALSRNLLPVEYFSKDVWVRGVTDITILNGATIFNGDYKTGKMKPESEQLRLSAAMVMAYKPFVEKSINAFIWLKHDGKITHEVVTRAELPDIWNGFMGRVNRLELAVAENKFPKKPSGLCRQWCQVTDCEFHGK